MGCELIVLATVLYATPDELLDPTSFGDERPVNLGGQWLIDAKKLRVIARGEAHVQTSVKDGKITQRYEANRDPTVADLSAEYLAVVRTRVRDRTVRRYGAPASACPARDRQRAGALASGGRRAERRRYGARVPLGQNGAPRLPGDVPTARRGRAMGHAANVCTTYDTPSRRGCSSTVSTRRSCLRHSATRRSGSRWTPTAT
jgi:hypothetical protein